MSTLDLAWISTQGAVRFTVTGVPDDGVTTVKRVNPGGTLSAIRGYPDGSWHGTTGLGYDYEAPMGALVSYAIVDRDATNLVPTTSYQTVATNLAQNPSLAGGSTAGWGNNSNDMAVALDTTGQLTGPNSFVSTRGATNLDGRVASIYMSPLATSLPAFPCVAGQPITASLQVKAQQANRKISAYWGWFNSSNASISYQATQLPVPNTGAAMTVWRPVITGIPPAGAVSALLVLTVDTVSGNAVSGEKVWFDALRVSTGPATLDATNLFYNPGVESTSSSGWYSNNTGLYTLSVDASAPLTGQYSIMTARTATTPNRTASSVLMAAGSAAGGLIPVTAGVQFSAGADVKAEAAGRQVEIYYQFYNSAGSYLADGVRGQIIPLTAGQVTRLTWTDTPPVGAASCGLVLTVTSVDGSAIPSGERVWFDTGWAGAGPFSGYTPLDGTYVYIWTGGPGSSTSQRWKVSGGDLADTVYFDGDMAPDASYVYRWSGTAKASTSLRQITVNSPPTSAVIFTQTPGRTNGEAWLRDVLQPVLSRPVAVVSTGDETYVARQSMLDVAGKSTPYVVWDSRQAKQGTITLLVRNKAMPPGTWDDASERLKLEALFTTGRPLLLSLCASKGYANTYLAIDSVKFTRNGTAASWLVDLDYFEVDNPTGLGVNVIPEVTYTQAQQLPPSAKYSDWVPVDYFTIATRTAIT